MLTFRREYLVDFLESLKGPYKHAWARSAIEMTWEHSHKQRERFVPGPQQDRVDALWTHLRDLMARKKASSCLPLLAVPW